MSEHVHPHDHEDHDHDHDHDELEDDDDALDAALEFESQVQIFLEQRRQNIDLLKLAIEVAGVGGQHPPLKRSDLESAMKSVWEIYSEFYGWIDPEETEDDLEAEEDDE
ncbi:MAG: hypothetical protein SFX72_18230 [Isosphaeraceae bacterium]|nr:hypothetical protein [Isosphaeraceae bacterium]